MEEVAGGAWEWTDVDGSGGSQREESDLGVGNGSVASCPAMVMPQLQAVVIVGSAAVSPAPPVVLGGCRL